MRRSTGSSTISQGEDRSRRRGTARASWHNTSLVVILSVLAPVGCKGGGGLGPYETAQNEVHHGLGKGTQQSNARENVSMRVRLNPAKCDCPPHEVFLWNHWQRVFVDAAEETLQPLERADSLATVSVIATLTGERRIAANGIKYRVVAVTAN